MTGILSVTITAASREEAETIARAVVEKRLAACVNIVLGVQSIYRWQGKVEEAREWMLLVKTTAATFAALQKLVKEMHSYECPCIVASPIVAGDAAYLAWVRDSVEDTVDTQSA